MKQLMGNLPSDRPRDERLFLITGVDFCGPAPHFGGLWQAAVKAAKTLVEKNLTSAHQALFLDVEAILNSQPIAPTSDDPNDIAAVTPAHLLTGTSLTSAAEAALHHHSDQPGKELRYVVACEISQTEVLVTLATRLCVHSSTTQ
ncbi:hypothetical protein ACLKA6_012283 [Drosophila palustris]